MQYGRGSSLAPPTFPGRRATRRSCSAAWAVALSLATACSAASTRTQPATGRPALPALAFDLPLIGGGRLNANALRGRYVVLKPFAAWCRPCWSELPLLVDASARFHEADVSFVAVSFDKSRAEPQSLVAELRIPFAVAHDPEGQLAAPLALRAFSALYLFGPDGHLVVRYDHCNPGTVEDLVRRLSRLTRRSVPPPDGAAG